MSEDAATLTRLERLLSSAASVVAPLSVLTALLFYFGYASSRARFAYFGVDVDTIGLSTQDYVMRSPQPLLTPLLTLVLLGVLLGSVHEAVRRRVDAVLAGAGTADPDTAADFRRRLTRMRSLARSIVRVGEGILAVGVLLLLGYAYLRRWAPYPLITPLLMAIGAAVALYGRRIAVLLGERERSRRTSLVALALVLATTVFWATATLAEWSGRGSAHDAARHLDRLPSVILDTKERLFLTSPHIAETALPHMAGQTYHYRYRRLRLLIQGRDRLFLVPDTWSASNSTLVVPTNDGSVRVQFQFQNQPPR